MYSVRKLDSIAPGTYREIILDAWYRFLPTGVEENSNPAMTGLYNLLDAMADRLKCGFVCIHHSSKGNQSNKAVTDVGAGAGAQARAADSHLVLRQHEEDRCFVLEAGARSFPEIQPVGVRFTFPVWSIDESLDPTLLRPDKPRRKKPDPPEPPDPWTAERFAVEFVTDTPRSKALVLAEASKSVGSLEAAKRLWAAAEGEGKLHRWTIAGRKREAIYANVPQPSLIGH